MKSSKISLIGCGNVGTTIAFTLATLNVFNNIVLIDKNIFKSRSEELDISHSLYNSYTKITCGDYEDIVDSDIIIVSAGIGRKPGESRFDLVSKNTAIAKDVAANIKEYFNSGILIVVSNPVDIITYVMSQELASENKRVIGTGTLLDTIRFRHELSSYFDVNIENINAYVLGVHGEYPVPIYSMANICGISLFDYAKSVGIANFNADMLIINERVKEAGAAIIKGKGATFYGIAGVIVHLVKAIINDAKAIFPISQILHGQYGFNDSSISLLRVVGKDGVELTLTPVLNDFEMDMLTKAVSLTKVYLENNLQYV